MGTKQQHHGKLCMSGNLENLLTLKRRKAPPCGLNEAGENVYSRARFLFELRFHWVDGSESRPIDSEILSDSFALLSLPASFSTLPE